MPTVPRRGRPPCRSRPGRRGPRRAPPPRHDPRARPAARPSLTDRRAAHRPPPARAAPRRHRPPNTRASPATERNCRPRSNTSAFRHACRNVCSGDLFGCFAHLRRSSPPARSHARARRSDRTTPARPLRRRGGANPSIRRRPGPRRAVGTRTSAGIVCPACGRSFCAPTRSARRRASTLAPMGVRT